MITRRRRFATRENDDRDRSRSGYRQSQGRYEQNDEDYDDEDYDEENDEENERDRRSGNTNLRSRFSDDEDYDDEDYDENDEDENEDERNGRSGYRNTRGSHEMQQNGRSGNRNRSEYDDEDYDDEEYEEDDYEDNRGRRTGYGQSGRRARRGFGSMSPERVRQLAREGGRASGRSRGDDDSDDGRGRSRGRSGSSRNNSGSHRSEAEVSAVQVKEGVIAVHQLTGADAVLLEVQATGQLQEVLMAVVIMGEEERVHHPEAIVARPAMAGEPAEGKVILPHGAGKNNC